MNCAQRSRHSRTQVLLYLGIGISIGLWTANLFQTAPAAAQGPPEIPAKIGPLANLQQTVKDLETELLLTQATVEDLQDKLAYVSIEEGEINGLAGPHVLFEVANVHIRNGLTATITTNGLGNLVVGYNEGNGFENRDGSHNLLVGRFHTYSSFGCFVAGHLNSVTGEESSVSGGLANVASGFYSSVSGGSRHKASGYESSVSGGSLRSANDLADWVAGSLFEED